MRKLLSALSGGFFFMAILFFAMSTMVAASPYAVIRSMYTNEVVYVDGVMTYNPAAEEYTIRLDEGLAVFSEHEYRVGVLLSHGGTVTDGSGGIGFFYPVDDDRMDGIVWMIQEDNGIISWVPEDLIECN